MSASSTSRTPLSTGFWHQLSFPTLSSGRVNYASFPIANVKIHAGGTAPTILTDLGFVEWYPWNGGEPPNHCVRLPYEMTMCGAPRTTCAGSVVPQGESYEYGNWVGRRVAFNTEKIASGVVNNCGFRGASGK